MEIKRFEAYNYRGPEIDKIDRKKFLEELHGQFTAGNFIGYEISGTMYHENEEVLYIYLSEKRSKGIIYENKVIKLDFSDLGIEIGTQEWNEEKEEYEEFIPEISLNTDEIKQMKNFKSDTKKYNL